MILTTTMLQDLKEKADKATAGLWYRYAFEVRTDFEPEIMGDEDTIKIAETPKYDKEPKDAQFIAAANPETVRSLVLAIVDCKYALERYLYTGTDRSICDIRTRKVLEKHFGDEK